MAGAAPSRRRLLLILCAALLAAGCEGGALTNHRQSCSSASGLLSEESVSCSGTAGSVRVPVGIEFGGGDDDEELFGTYRLTAVLRVGGGERLRLRCGGRADRARAPLARRAAEDRGPHRPVG